MNYGSVCALSPMKMNKMSEMANSQAGLLFRISGLSSLEL